MARWTKGWTPAAALLAVGIIMMMIPAGCGGGGGDGDDGGCDCDLSPVTEENGLAITYESQSVRFPANVSLLFKVDATAGRSPVTGLTAENFMIYEDGDLISRYESRQAILPKPGKFRSHTLLLLDLSGSILESENLPALKQAAREFVFAVMNESGSGLDMAVYWFDGARNLHPLVPNFIAETTTLLNAIAGINPDMSADPSTNLYGAAIDGIQMMSGRVGAFGDVVAVGSVVLFTDGTDQANWRTREEALAAVRDANQAISIYTIGIKGETDENVLTAIGRNGALLAENVTDLVPRFAEIAERIQRDANSHYLLEYCSPKRLGAHDLRVTAVLEGLSGSLITCFCANGFSGGCRVGGI